MFFLKKVRWMLPCLWDIPQPQVNPAPPLLFTSLGADLSTLHSDSIDALMVDGAMQTQTHTQTRTFLSMQQQISV